MMVDYDLGKVVGDKGETGNGIASITLHSTSGKVKTYRITYTDGTTFDFQVRDGNDASVTVDSALSSTSVNPVQNKVINSALNGKANSSHSHSISDVSNLQSSLDGKSDTGHTHTKSNITDFAHTHDDRYYTESETDTLLDGKASSSHSHSKSDITDFPSIPSASSTTPSADTTNGSVGTGTTYARSNHTHPKSSLYAEASHNHTISNVTDLQSSLDGKASTSHNHTKSDITDFPTIPSKTSDLTNDSGFLTSHQDISGKEDNSNKVSNWSSTTNNTRYPSEKLVKDSLDGKANSSHTHTKSQITDFPTIPSKTSDLTNDGDDGSNVFVKDNDSRLSDARTPTSHTHGQITNDGALTSQPSDIASADKILITDNSDNNYIKRVSFITTGHIRDNSAHSNIGTLISSTQAVINTAIDGKIGDLEDLIGDAISYINQ